MIPNPWYVVLFSNPIKTRPVGVKRMGENLVRGNTLILEYRKRRQARIEQASK